MKIKTLLFLGALVILYPMGLDLSLVEIPSLREYLSTSKNGIGCFFEFCLFGVVISLVIAGKIGVTSMFIVDSLLFSISSRYYLIMQDISLYRFVTTRFIQ